MMGEVKVSVIIPVYNTAAYVRQAIESIMDQTLKEIEILVVNDGSTDDSGDILCELAEKDNRITVFTQENRGLSEARNRALPHVTGKYLYFMDSDDFLEADCLELCYKRCEDQELDFVFFDAENRLEMGAGASMQNYSRKGLIDEYKVYRGSDLFNEQMDKYLFRPSVWLTFVRVDFMRTCFVRFYSGIIHEDHLFTVPLYLNARRVGYIARMFFKRRARANSIMNRPFSMRNIQGYKVTAEELSEYAIHHKECSVLIRKYLKQMLNAVVWQAHKLPFSAKMAVFGWLFEKKYIRDISFRNLVVFWLKK